MIEGAPALIGVDGCRAGWVGATYDGAAVRIALYDSFGVMIDALAGERAALCMVDMPIGLPERDNRACDAANRAALPGGASSVFSAPLRCLLEEETYESACALSREHHRRGLAISKQSWFLFPKIREVDAVARDARYGHVLFRETHPELVFRDWSGGEKLSSKKTAEGLSARRALAATLSPNVLHAVDAFIAGTKRKDVAIDDIYDALACLRVAARVESGDARAVLATPERDAFGLEMNVWF
ncbi:MAG: putative RNase H-like nuclease [Bradymonadia bacterium]|jgi:predicted RNase H-like nuclease